MQQYLLREEQHASETLCSGRTQQKTIEYVVARTSKGLSAKGRARERKIELVPGAGGCTG